MPQFTPGETKRAKAPITVKPSGLSCETELYLVSGTTKVVTSGLILFTSIGAAQDITFPIIMPSASGTYKVYLDIFAAGILIGAYQAIEDVIIALAGARITVLGITASPVGKAVNVDVEWIHHGLESWVSDWAEGSWASIIATLGYIKNGRQYDWEYGEWIGETLVNVFYGQTIEYKVSPPPSDKLIVSRVTFPQDYVDAIQQSMKNAARDCITPSDYPAVEVYIIAYRPTWVTYAQSPKFLATNLFPATLPALNPACALL